MRKHSILFFLLLITNFLIAENVLDYAEDEWEWNYNDNTSIGEKELFDLVEHQKEESIKNIQKPKSNYFTKMYVEGIFNWKGNGKVKNRAVKLARKLS